VSNVVEMGEETIGICVCLPAMHFVALEVEPIIKTR
jgi:hypothetical protein